MNAFFSTEKPLLTAFNVGHQGDCGFRAAAAGIIDNFLAYPNLNKALLNHLLARHFIYYPSHGAIAKEPQKGCSSMNKVITNVPLPELTETMAYTLRQFAVDEMLTKPGLEYYPILQAVHRASDMVALRRYDTWMEPTSILALANTLNISIDIRKLTSGKELLVPALVCNPHAEHRTTNPKIVIELEEKHYRPRLINPHIFNSITYESDPPLLKPTHTDSPDAYNYLHIQTILEKEKKRITKEFDHERSRLMSMVRADELTKKRLLDEYIKYAGIYASLPSYEFMHNIASHSYMKAQDEEMIEGMVMAMSYAIALGKLNAHDVFEALERKGPYSREQNL